jgi:radical SAM superfamily enzyme YgiQ (UPF0313 family)
MKKILLIYPPFCTPASPPYSITNLYSFLKANSSHNIEVLDLNLEFHKLKFPKYQKYYQKKDWKDYDEVTKEYSKISRKTYSENNKGIVKEQKPEFFKELLNKIKEKKPDIIVFSIVYSSQVFYAHSIIKELNIEAIVGGPSVNKILSKAAKTLNNEIELLEYLGEKPKIFKTPLDFSIYNLNEYFTPYPVIPIRTSSTCYYKGCTFCTHFNRQNYFEFDLEIIKQSLINSKQKHFFLIDDMLSKKRLLEFAEKVKELNIKYTCQLRPTKDLDFETLKKLRKSGLTMIMWGVESGNDRILNLIRKGTNKKDIEDVLKNSHNAGIKNIVYMIFGFPTETKDEFLETIEFLKNNQANIDLVSVSVFGLQKNTEIYNNPEKFGIKKIIQEKRTLLEPKISYELKTGLTQKQANKLRESYKKTIEKINKYPKTMNFFREHMFCLI